MSREIAKIIATVINPLVILSLVPFLLTFKVSQNLQLSLFWEIISLFFLGAFSVFILTAVKLKYFSDLDVSNRKQRPALFSAGLLVTAFYIFTVYFLNGPKVLLVATFGLILGLWMAEIINKKIKISMHVAAVTGFASLLVITYDYNFSLAYLLVPLVAWARIKTNNHTFSQTVVGAVFALLLTFAIYIIFNYIRSYV